MTDDAKRKWLALLLLAAIMLVLIAVALPQLDLKPGIPLPKWASGTGQMPTEDMPAMSISVSTFFEAILEIIAILILAYIVYKILKGVPWKQLVGPTLSMVVVAIVVLLILFALVNINVTPVPPEMDVPPPVLKADGPPLGSPPAILIWIVWIGLAAVVVLVGIQIGNQRTRQARARDPLTLEAERALESLRTGLDFKNVIVQCYRQMSLVLQKEQGIELEDTMTAREFERLLEARGIPRAPVHQLTQLFEAARYSLQPLTSADEQTAFDCLSAIVHASHARKPELT
jgi:hypothetical protein